MIAGTGWRAMYAPKLVTGTGFDFAWSTKVDVIGWGPALLATADAVHGDTLDGGVVVGWVIDPDEDSPGRGVLRPAHLATVLGADGRTQEFVTYLPPTPA
jgi:hypothetical protein